MRRLALLLFLAAAAMGCATSETVESVEFDVDDPVLSGRTVLAETQGKPHVLWFWGAH